MQNSQPDTWERWYQGAAYAAIGLILALAMIVLVASEDLPWYLYVLPAIFVLQSIGRFVQVKIAAHGFVVGTHERTSGEKTHRPASGIGKGNVRLS